jgi:hypothetical protein
LEVGAVNDTVAVVPATETEVTAGGFGGIPALKLPVITIPDPNVIAMLFPMFDYMVYLLC